MSPGEGGRWGASLPRQEGLVRSGPLRLTALGLTYILKNQISKCLKQNRGYRDRRVKIHDDKRDRYEAGGVGEVGSGGPFPDRDKAGKKASALVRQEDSGALRSLRDENRFGNKAGATSEPSRTLIVSHCAGKRQRARSPSRRGSSGVLAHHKRQLPGYRRSRRGRGQQPGMRTRIRIALPQGKDLGSAGACEQAGFGAAPSRTHVRPDAQPRDRVSDLLPGGV